MTKGKRPTEKSNGPIRKPFRAIKRPLPGTIDFMAAEIVEGRYVSPETLSRALANHTGPLPHPVRDLICRYLEGKVEKPRGPKSAGEIERMRRVLAAQDYRRIQNWLRERKKRCGLDGCMALRQASWWQGPPAERAARMVAKRWFGGRIQWRHVQNIVSSEK